MPITELRNSPKAVIFGSNGQDGHYLRKLLAQKGIECLCISRSGDAVHGDVGDYPFVENQIRDYQPSYIFHLAAISTTQHRAQFENHQTICTGTLNILESVRLHTPECKVFISGSAMQFQNDGIPINEKTPFSASSAYSVSRIQSVYAARYYRAVFGVRTYVGYFFNHDSSLRSEQHVNQKIIQSVNRIRNGSTEKLELGNIDVRKEFSFAGDIVEAIWILVNQDSVSEAVIGSGIAYSIRDWTEYCFQLINKNWKDHVIISKKFTPEYDLLVSDPAVIRSLDWKPKVTMYKLAEMMLADEIND